MRCQARLGRKATNRHGRAIEHTAPINPCPLQRDLPITPCMTKLSAVSPGNYKIFRTNTADPATSIRRYISFTKQSLNKRESA